MRIVHVSDCYSPRTGGIETQVAALAGRQQASGREVVVVTATPGHGPQFAGDDVVDGVHVRRVAAHLPFELPVHPRTVREVGAVLEATAPDVVHVHAGVVSPFAWGAVRAATRRAIPTLVTVHSIWGPIAGPGFGLADHLACWTGWGAHLSAVSAVAADRIARAVPRAGRILVVPNGIDPTDWSTPETTAEPDLLRVTSVLRMAPRKRTGTLVRILAAAAEALEPSIRLTATLVGDGPQRAQAQRWIGRRGLADRIAFAGRLGRADLLDVLARSDVFVQPSIRESFGLAALEARTAGLAVVARSQTGSSQFVRDGVEGFLADSDAGLVRAVVRLGRDRALLDRIRSHNRTTPPDQAWPTVLGIVDDAYRAAGART